MDNIIISEILNAKEKSNICNEILRALPNWFGIESSVVDYVGQVQTMLFYAAFHRKKTVGFVAVKVHNSFTAEIYVMGVLKEFHRQGLGKKLIECCESYCTENMLEFLTVKTLDESRESKSYENTRRFYLSVGFRPLEVFPLHWDENNPCLFLAKWVGRGGNP